MAGMEEIIRTMFAAITHQNLKSLKAIYNPTPCLSTCDAGKWYTARNTYKFTKTHMNRCVFDSSWELACAQELDRNPYVLAWVKNEHLGFEIAYIHAGAQRIYRPDFIVKLPNEHYIIIEIKGVKKSIDQSKWDFMNTWIKAVNQDREYGIWHFQTLQDASGQAVHSIIENIKTKSRVRG